MAKFFLRFRAGLFLVALCAGVGCQPPGLRAQEPPELAGSRPLSSLSGATGWLNSRPLTAHQLKGKVVLVDFWTYSCINCLRSLPYVEAWAKKYQSDGLVVIGVHTPEFGFEQKLPNVRQAIQRYGITYPVALDSSYVIWNAFHNEAWPAEYFIDVHGRVRYEHDGEGHFAQSEEEIQALLKERNVKPVSGGVVDVLAQGAEEPADMSQIESPETYIGYARASGFVSPGGIRPDAASSYTLPAHLSLNEWGFEGTWADHEQAAVLKSPGGRIVFRFHARDLHLVLGPAADGRPVRFRVTIDGHAPGKDHGVDTNAQGYGVVKDFRLYQLVRQQDGVRDQIFTIEFQDPGVQAFSFTFG
ncbi:MAG: thioredoxin family protein [Terracidiphilus sp.]